MSIQAVQTTYNIKVVFNQQPYTSKPTQAIQLTFSSLEDMNSFSQIQFMDENATENQAQIKTDEATFSKIIYISQDSAAKEIVNGKLILTREAEYTEDIQVNGLVFQTFEAEQMHRYDIEQKNNQIYEIMISKVQGPSQVTCYVSQDEFRPNAATSVQTITIQILNSSETYSIVLDQFEVDVSKPIYISLVTNSETSSYIYAIAKEGYLIDQLQEDKRIIVSIQNGQQLNYIFKPYWMNYLNQKQQSDMTSLEIEMNHENYQKLVDNNVEIKAYINRVSAPDTKDTSKVINFADYKVSVQDKDYVKILYLLSSPKLLEEFITIKCIGEKCVEIQSLAFNISINTMNELNQWKATEQEYLRYRDDDKPTNLYFRTEQNDVSHLKIFVPINDAKVQKVQCNEVMYKVSACIGTYPDDFVRQNIDKFSCEEKEMTSELTQQQNYIELTIDTKMEKFAPGIVFMRIQPISNSKILSQCKSQINQFTNKQLLGFGEAMTYAVSAGYGEQKALHLITDVPVMSGKAATENSYGDRLALEWRSGKPVHVCISDDIDNYYPYYISDQKHTCTLYYNQGATSSTKTIIYLQNYNNYNSSIPNMQPSTRIYISVWSDEVKVSAGSDLYFNITLSPQQYFKYNEMPKALAFTSKWNNGNYKYLNFAFDISDATQRQEIESGSFIIGIDCSTKQCRENPPEAWFQQDVVTYAACDTPSPYQDYNKIKKNDKGLQYISVADLLAGEQTDIRTLFFQIKYRRYLQLVYSKNVQSDAKYVIYFQPNFTSSSVIPYQSSKTITPQTTGKQSLHTYVIQHPIVPSELVIYPCRGAQKLYVDSFSSNPKANGKLIQADSPGHAFGMLHNGSSYNYINQFISIEADEESEYQIFWGNQAEQYTPGNNGQIVVKKFDGYNNKLEIEFTPARAPLQTEIVSSLNYYMYIIPYSGKFDQQKDYSPYTKCGIEKAGYSAYKDNQGMDRLLYDEENVKKTGKITIKANQDLFQNGVSKDSTIYVTVYAYNQPYQTVLLGTGAMKAGAIAGIVCGVIGGVIVIVAAVFGILLYKKKQQQKKAIEVSSSVKPQVQI